ncbi:MAG: bifunctional phosphopantothenoylcysteine decarboxylase/phosphopantothenate--cysteine ligase CoaBC [Bacteroidales bacterium]|nr:bifunctional phosphopantothenoylcysteine decarboxylase/phosphopantothenate--cysteine ligase CoaBC [Bacteroidales bacterium]
MMLDGKKVLVGISGGIAAYKVPLLVRLLVKKGCEVKVIVTDNALEFVTEMTLQTLSSHKIYHNMFTGYNNEESTEHISLANWADMMIVAPATANIIGKYANGIADDALSTTLLAFNKTVFLSPAMNSNMYSHIAVQTNLQKLKTFGVELIDAKEGFLACGVNGKGRMAEPEEIVEYVENYFSKQKDFIGKTFTVTAGPTREQIDRVRFISNNSSGKMGYAIAKELLNRGAEVFLVSGPTSETINETSDLHLIKIESAEQMYDKTIECFEKSDVAICSAAVADYTPKQKFDTKLKKQEGDMFIELSATKDILKSLGEKKEHRILVGFALETDNEIENAKKKLINKNLDFIVLNSLKDEGAGFEVSTNKVTLIDKDNITPLPLKSKTEVAKDIVDKVLTYF